MKQTCMKMLMLTMALVNTIVAYSQEERNKPLQVVVNDVSLCKVQSGGKDIKAAMDAGKDVVVVTTD